MTTNLLCVTDLLLAVAIFTAVLAAMNVWMARQTFRSQKESENLLTEMKKVLKETEDIQSTLLGDMNNALKHMHSLQEKINDREHRSRQERARTAVNTLMKALRRQAHWMDGRWTPNARGLGLTLKDDPLELIRAYESELT